MRNLNHTAGRLTNRWWKLPILVFLLMVLGIFFSPAESAAQAPPPRGQSLQMIRPLVPQPEPPVEKEIRENRQAIEKNKRELERKIAAQQLLASYKEDKMRSAIRLNRYMSVLVKWAGKSAGALEPVSVKKPNGEKDEWVLYRMQKKTNKDFCDECFKVDEEGLPVNDLRGCIERAHTEWGYFVSQDESISTMLNMKKGGKK